MPRRRARVLLLSALAAGLALTACSSPAPPAPAPASAPSVAPTTGQLVPGVPTEGTRPDTTNLSLAAEPQSAPAPTTPPPGRQVQVGQAPEGVVVDPVTRTVAVATRNPNALVLLDADTGAVRATTPLPGFVRHLQLAAPGGPVLVPVESANSLVRVNLPGGQADPPLFVGTVPHDATQAPNGTAMTADELGGTVSAIRDGRVMKMFTDAVQPAGLAPVGNLVGLVDVRKNDLTVYDVDALRIVGSAPSGAGPTHLVADRHGRMIATDTRGNQVIVFQPNPDGPPTQVGAVPQPGGPYGITYDPVRDRVWVASSGTNEVIGYDMTDPQPREVSRIATVQNPYTVGVDPQTGRLFVAGVSTGVVQIVDVP
ncbi:YncE family protein [Actinomycetospora termitidis]|uniref:YncE family protein n=1 Tax=Actinomycetospora termitidis TaxID=3053470 RepID=A0ABT7M486_9PSEU|nr:YncE family protein [Actinomycetospora sp. Odt1-22]MDL5154562.1 YncE family protein [Actinomycetospora sp. Odt1-22]